MSTEDGNNSQLPSEGLLAGKYKTEEELQKGILELAKKKSDGKLEDFYKSLEKDTLSPPVEEPMEPVEPMEPKDTSLQIPEEDVLDKSEQEFFAEGVLTEETKRKLLDSGIFKNEKILDTYFKGLNSQATDFKQSLFEITGDELGYRSLVEWGRDNLSTDEITVFNKALGSGNITEAKLAVEAVKARYQAKGNTINIIDKGQTPQTVVRGYSTKAEMARDMQDARYEQDESYRKAVEEKIRRTTAF